MYMMYSRDSVYVPELIFKFHMYPLERTVFDRRQLETKTTNVVNPIVHHPIHQSFGIILHHQK